MTQIFSISPAGSGKLVSIERIIDWQRDAYRQIINEQLSEIINLIIHLPVLLLQIYG
jgi:hypothetical protein